jgi:tetratricopeptide (TPR) repeat protein
MASDDQAKAIENYEKALSMFRKLGDRTEEAKVLLQLGVAYRDSGDHSQSIRCFETAVAVCTKLGDRFLLANALILVATGYSSPPEPTSTTQIALGERAIEPAQRGLAIAREIGDRDLKKLGLQTLATVHSQLGLFELDFGDLTQAESHFKEELVAARELSGLREAFDDRGTESEALWGLGTICLRQSRFQDAKRHLSDGLKAARAIKNKRHEAMIVNGLGKVYLASKELTLASDQFSRQLDLARKIRDQKSEADALWGMAIVCMTRQKPADAAKHLAEALRIAREGGDERQQIQIASTIESLASALKIKG